MPACGKFLKSTPGLERGRQYRTVSQMVILQTTVREKGASPRFAAAGQIAATGTLGPLSHWRWIHSSRRVCLHPRRVIGSGNYQVSYTVQTSTAWASSSGAGWLSNKRGVSPRRLQPCMNCSQRLCFASCVSLPRIVNRGAERALGCPTPAPAPRAWCSPDVLASCPLPF